MKQGHLADYFIGVGAKVLRDTEINPAVSNGHEFQGVSDFRGFLGPTQTKVTVPATYIWLSDEDEPIRSDLTATWYDSRAKKRTDRTAEYRLYYPAASEEVVYRARAGDTLFLCQPKSGPLLALLCAHGSSIEQQLLWLFGLQLTADFSLSQADLRENPGRSLDFTSRYILELIGIEVLATEQQWLSKLLSKFGEKFPSTREFSAFARKAVGNEVDLLADPDNALMRWMEMEERLFMTLEKHVVSRRLEHGFMTNGEPDVDAFVSFSLGVQNRRKSRAGWAFANHVQAILDGHNIVYKREATTEKRAGPDFLFPGETAYHTQSFDASRLTILAVKTSCKDRWRQVLAEADRVSLKHLLTLEPGISGAQTEEMRRSSLQLVLPYALHQTYKPDQQRTLLRVNAFLDLVKERAL